MIGKRENATQCWPVSSASDLEDNKEIFFKKTTKTYFGANSSLGYRKANFYQFLMAKRIENARKYLVRR